jgi:hypothetical protein
LGVPAGADGGSSWCKQLSDRSSPTVWRQIGCRWPRASSRASDTLPCMTWPWRKTRGREDARTRERTSLQATDGGSRYSAAALEVTH